MCTVRPTVLRPTGPDQIRGRWAEAPVEFTDEHRAVENVVRRRRARHRLVPQTIRCVGERARRTVVRALVQPVLAVPGVGPAPAGQRVAVQVAGIAVGAQPEQHVRLVVRVRLGRPIVAVIRRQTGAAGVAHRHRHPVWLRTDLQADGTRYALPRSSVTPGGTHTALAAHGCRWTQPRKYERQWFVHPGEATRHDQDSPQADH